MKTSKTYSPVLLLILLGMAVGVTSVVAQGDAGYWAGDNIDHKGYLPIVLRQMGPLDEEMERNVLIAFYQSTNGDGWENSDGWLGPETHCSWYGVGCDNGSVTDLDLYYNQLSGPIPKELANLSRMRVLYLSANQLSGPVPKELGNLSSLQSLSLFSNQLSGPIPKELGNLSNLGLLSLSYNQLSGPIPKELGNLDNLWGLDLRFNQLSCWETWEVLQWALGFGCAKYPWDPGACFDYPTPGETICS